MPETALKNGDSNMPNFMDYVKNIIETHKEKANGKGDIRTECPSCGKKNFTVNINSGIYNCFNGCSLKGKVTGLSNTPVPPDPDSEKEKQQKQRKTAKWMLDNSLPVVTHPYLQKKQVKAYPGVRSFHDNHYDKDVLLIPVYDSKGLLTIQKIFPEKITPKTGGDPTDKMFIGSMKGGYFKIQGNDKNLYLCEGYATGASIAEATGGTVYIAFNAGNLENVLREIIHIHTVKDEIGYIHPNQRITICADNDHKKESEGKGNPGKDKALKIALEHNFEDTKIVYPIDIQGTDFNDLAIEKGSDAVKKRIAEAWRPDRSELPKEPEKKIEIPDNFEEELLIKSKDDPGYPFESSNLKILVKIKDSHPAQWQRLRAKLKDCTRITDLESEIAKKKKKDDSNPEQSNCADMLKPYGANKYGYDYISENWLEYNDTGIWKKITDYQFYQWIEHEFKDILPQGYSMNYLFGVGKLVSHRLPFELIEQPYNLIPFANGVFNLETKEITDYSPEMSWTWQLPYEYDPTGQCQPILDFLHHAVSENINKINIIRAYLRAILLGRTDLQIFLEMVGAGGGGKGTVIWLAQQLIGLENIVITELKHLEQNRFETGKLYNKRLCIINDAERYAGDVSNLKSLTGGDLLRFEEKNKNGNMNNFKPKCMVLIAANYTIQSSEYTSGLARRRLTLFFDNPVPSEKQRDLQTEFKPYIPGFLNWVLEMSDAEMINCLKAEARQTISSDLKQCMLDTNPLAQWVNERLIFEKGAKAYIGNRDSSDSRLFADYFKYSEAANIKEILSLQDFSNLLVDLCRNQLRLEGIEKKRDSNGNFIKNLKLKGEYDNSESPLDIAFKQCVHTKEIDYKENYQSVHTDTKTVNTILHTKEIDSSINSSFVNTMNTKKEDIKEKKNDKEGVQKDVSFFSDRECIKGMHGIHKDDINFENNTLSVNTCIHRGMHTVDSGMHKKEEDNKNNHINSEDLNNSLEKKDIHTCNQCEAFVGGWCFSYYQFEKVEGEAVEVDEHAAACEKFRQKVFNQSETDTKEFEIYDEF